jgi:hypothetical protein
MHIHCADENTAIRTLQRMNQYRIVCRQEHPELKSDYDPYIYRRRGEYIEIDEREVLDGNGRALSIDAINGIRKVSLEDAEKLMQRAANMPVTPEIQASLDALKAHQDMLKHGPHRLDPDKPLIDDEE